MSFYTNSDQNLYDNQMPTVPDYNHSSQSYHTTPSPPNYGAVQQQNMQGQA